MHVKMTKTTKGSRDGRFTEQFLIDNIYDLTDAGDLADVFVKTLKVAKIVKAPVVDIPKDPVEETEEKLIQDMTAHELKTLAETNDINIRGITKVNDLRTAVMLGLEALANANENEEDL